MNALLHPRANGALFVEPNVISEDDGLRFGGRLRDHRLARRITLDRAEHVSASERRVRFRQLPPKKAAKTTIDTEHAAVADKPAWARLASLGSSSSDASSRDEIERSRDEPPEGHPPAMPLHDAPAEDDDKSLVGTDILTEQWEALLDMFDGATLACCYEGDTGVEAVAYRKKSRRASLEELAGLAFVVSEEG